MVEPDTTGYHAYFPALKGLHVDGETEIEVLHNAAEAAAAYIESLVKHDDPIPVGVIPAEGKAGSSPSLHVTDIDVAVTAA